MHLTPEQIAERLADRNPFSTRFVRPGAVAYRFPEGGTLQMLVDQLARQEWRGEIVGPHGSGKSTLIRTLIPMFEDAGKSVQLFTLRVGQSRFPVSASILQSWGANTLVIVDGYEQLGGWTRTLIHRVGKRHHSGLLVTSHETAGLPTLWSTAPSLEITQALVRDMQPRPRVLDRDVETSFHRHAGNIREVFFELYDLYEQRRE